MSRTLRAALTQTVNAYAPMPARVEDLGALAGKLAAVREANLAHHVELLRAAARRGVKLCGLGELFSAPYFALHRDPMWKALAEDPCEGPTATAIRAAAKELGLVVVAPLYELAPDGRRFNTAVVVDEEGRVLGKYRKTHIPAGRNEQGAFHETEYFEASDGDLGNPPGHNVSTNPSFPVFRTSVGKLGVAICYDRHFEGVVATLAAEGAEIVLSPAVTFGAQSRRMWPLEFAVDAARHGVVIGGSNRLGQEPPWNQPFFGASHWVGPDGPFPDTSDHPGLVIADLVLREPGRPDPSGWDLARDRRPSIYSR